MSEFVESVRRFTGRWAPMVAFLLVALAGGYAIQRSSQADAELLHEGLVQACERANVRDRNANHRTMVMAEVLEAAAESREREAQIASDPREEQVNRQVAERYRELVGRLPYAEPIDCEEAVLEP